MLAKLLILIAVLLMPLGMAPAGASAHEAHAAAMPMQHCPEQGTKHRPGAFAQCTMACASALPAADRIDEQPMPYVRLFAAAVPVLALHGLHPDTATPPPKGA